MADISDIYGKKLFTRSATIKDFPSYKDDK